MKLSIKSESYGITPAPKLTKRMFEFLWSKKIPFILNHNKHLYPVESINIRVNQALFWMDYHFYITFNNDVENENNTFHVQFGENDIKRYLESKQDTDSIMFEDYQKGYDSKKWNFYSNILGYRLSELNMMFNLSN